MGFTILLCQPLSFLPLSYTIHLMSWVQIIVLEGGNLKQIGLKRLMSGEFVKPHICII